MRCEDCLAVIEDYFDGELEAEAAALVAAHLPSCDECAAAHEALEAEQAIYLRYDRGLEVTPALWEGVRAAVARAAEDVGPAAAPAPSRPAPLSRLRGLFGGAFAALTLRPALASSLALLIFAVVAGSLLLGPSGTRQTGPQQVADSGAAARPDDSPATQVERPAASAQDGDAADPVVASSTPAPAGRDDEGAAGLLVASAPRQSRAGARPPGVPPPGPGSIGAPPAVAAAGPDAAPPDPDHLEVAGGDLLPLVRAVSLDVEDAEEVAAGAARMLDPEEKEVARHVERAQMLLRSFRNTRASERSAAEDAYEKELSRRLLEENVALRAEAESAGDKSAGRVLEAIQPFLLDIANMREKPSRQEVRSIKERMRKTEIVAALQVY